MAGPQLTPSQLLELLNSGGGNSVQSSPTGTGYGVTAKGAPPAVDPAALLRSLRGGGSDLTGPAGNAPVVQKNTAPPPNKYQLKATAEGTRLDKELADQTAAAQKQYDDAFAAYPALESAVSDLDRQIAVLQGQIANGNASLNGGSTGPYNKFGGPAAPHQNASAEAQLRDLIAKRAVAVKATTDNGKVRDNAKATIATLSTTGKADVEKKKQRLSLAVEAVTGRETANKKVVDSNKVGKAAYDKSLAEYGSKEQAYRAYLDAKKTADDHNAAIQSDVASGKYNVDPYDFVQGVHTAAEQDNLEKQLDAGQLAPTMRTPGLDAAPAQVAAPGAAPTAPTYAAGVDPNHEYDAEYKTLGYVPPATPDASNVQDTATPSAASPTTPTETKPTAVKSSPPAGATSAAKFANRTPAAPAAPTPTPTPTPAPAPAPTPAAKAPAAPATNNLQATSQTAAPTNTTQATSQTAPAPAAPTNPAGSIAPQTSGTVSGQTTSTPQATPDALTNPQPAPTPFKDPNEKDEDPDVFHI